MPTNEKLIEDILALAPNAEVEGLTNSKLAALLKQLRAAHNSTDVEIVRPAGIQLGAPLEEDAPASTTLEPESTTPEHKVEEPKPTPTAAEPTKVLSVAEGKAITSKRGVLGPGEEVRAEYFVGGEETLQSLKKQGTIK